MVDFEADTEQTTKDDGCSKLHFCAWQGMAKLRAYWVMQNSDLRIKSNWNKVSIHNFATLIFIVFSYILICNVLSFRQLHSSVLKNGCSDWLGHYSYLHVVYYFARRLLKIIVENSSKSSIYCVCIIDVKLWFFFVCLFCFHSTGLISDYCVCKLW